MAKIEVGAIRFLICIVFVTAVRSQKVYDFEDATVPTEITSQSSLQLSTSRHKNGSKSLEWQWNAGHRLTWDLSSNLVDLGRRGGIKFWIYNTQQLVDECLLVCIRVESSQAISCFKTSLNFEGWRAVWVAYREFIGCPSMPSASQQRGSSRISSNSMIDQLYFRAPSTATGLNPLHIDTLQFESNLRTFTRDSIVPPITYTRSSRVYCTSCANISSGLTEEDARNYEGQSARWRDIYRWSLRAVPTPSPTLKMVKLQDINEITQRLINWYANESKVFSALFPSTSSTNSPFLIHRWNSLLENIDRAHKEFKKLSQGTASGSPTSGLFGRNSRISYPSENGAAKTFADVFYKMLLPSALEYFVKSRSIETNYDACEFAKIYNCTSGAPLEDGNVEVITGMQDSILKSNFTSSYNNLPPVSSSPATHPTCSTQTQACVDHVKDAINGLNTKRAEKILELFKYLKDQGFDKGGALGQADREALSMQGFVHSMFLMRNQLKLAGLLDDIIDTMKWYTTFNEVYQTSFDYEGTSADAARTILMFRLLTVLVMPEDNDLQKREKIRDMDALRRWINNALTINEGLDGLIKPDFTCFHHRNFYASAYCISALHQASVVSYLLSGTRFELSNEANENLINALKVFRVVAVKYSTPSAVGGRFPNYNQAGLAQHVPAYAYLAAGQGISLNNQSSQVRMFLRLYTYAISATCTGKLNERLCRGGVPRIFYLNTLGSLDIMDRVKFLASQHASSSFFQPEQSPSGHWSKQFASFSIHRRANWAVTVKGFDKYVWDYENGAGSGENRYGMFASHGSLFIANSESAVSSKDVDSGWDWRKIPGTTAINVDYSDMLIGSDRLYNSFSEAMAGGVALQGSKSREEKNGVFGMNYKLPQYEVQSNSPFHSTDFRFKKSVFFYDDIIAAMGSNLTYTTPGTRKRVYTALFQDTMPQNPSAPPTETNIFRCNDNAGSLKKSTWGNVFLVILVDVNGNRYYIPYPDKQGLVFRRNERQDSFKSRGNRVSSSGVYCTAWIDHGKNPNRPGKGEYDFAIQVDAEPVGGPAKPVFNGLIFEVIKKDESAHIVKFHPSNGRGTVYGYVVFPESPPPSGVNLGSVGPLESVYNQSIIMVEETTTTPKRLYVSVSSPQLKLRLKQDPQSSSNSLCQGINGAPVKYGDVKQALLWCSRSSKQTIVVNLRNVTQWSSLVDLHVDGKNLTNMAQDYLDPPNSPTQNPIKFIGMINGADTEVIYEE